MPCCYQTELRYDVKAIDAHLLSKGLVPNSGKWLEVWYRKRHKFLIKD